MLIQCTKKLLDQLNIKPEEQKEEDPLFSWHANLIMMNRRKAVILVNDLNRYVIVLYGLKAKDFKKLDELVAMSIRGAFEEEGIKDDVINKYIQKMGPVTYTKTRDKTSVARMNKSCEAVSFGEDLFREDTICQNSISRRVGMFLVGNGKDYIYPNEELYKNLESFWGGSIFQSRAAVLKAELRLKNQIVLRRIVIPLNMTFNNLHKVLQTAFGWKEYHLHEYYIYEDDKRYLTEMYFNHPAYNEEVLKPVVNLVCSEEALGYPNEVEMRLEDGLRLSEYITKYNKLKYNYDLGDNWQHYIEVEKIIDNYDKNYPVCLEGEGKTPPEDVGGEPGYEEFLKIIADEKNPEYKETLFWAESQGYKEFDIEWVNRMLKYI